MLLLPAPQQPVALLAAPKRIFAIPAVASRKVRIFSFGGGVQSHAVLALQAAGKLPEHYDYFVFCNVGHDSENPDTLAYIERYTMPFCEQHGIQFVETHRKRRNGQQYTLMEKITGTERSVPIPARMGGNGAPGNRTCTVDFKIQVVDRYIREHSFSHAVIGLGISLDEFHRARSTNWHSFDDRDGHKLKFDRKREYPLIDLRLNRQQCRDIIREANLPEPPKSSCWFCPFHKRSEWIEMKREKPELFQKAVELERLIQHKRTFVLAKDKVYLHPDLISLDQAVGNQLPLFSTEVMDACESGFCMT